MEVTAIRQRLEHGFIFSKWVNSEKQMADGLTKPQAAGKLLEIVSAGKWKIVWDAALESSTNFSLSMPFSTNASPQSRRSTRSHLRVPSRQCHVFDVRTCMYSTRNSESAGAQHVTVAFLPVSCCGPRAVHRR